MAEQNADSAIAESLPFGAELSKAPNKKFQDLVLLVPFFGAKQSQLHRHVEFLNEIGFDAVTFDLKPVPKSLNDSLISSQGKVGMKHVWADQIEALLNLFPGKKIVYAFSNPSASAIEAVARRGALDIAGMVCDSGPSGMLFDSMLNYFTYEEPIRILPLKIAAAATFTMIWNPSPKPIVENDLSKIPAGFQILSIRGWKDKLMSPHQIDMVFEPHQHIDWKRLSLPQAGHLNGLKHFSEDYAPAVSEFLSSIATAIENQVQR